MRPSLDDKDSASAPYQLLAAVAIAIGLYARFKGLGFAPIAIDEYYLSRSIDGILKYGIPAFDCGGLYQRGFGLQYLVAALRSLGLSAELAPRLVAAVSSALMLPALFLVARRVVSKNIALVIVSVAALSLWEVEMARFGRFYAPFQALFAWYLVYFLRYTVDQNANAWKGMLALTIAGVFVWEGAIFLALANCIPALVSLAETGRMRRRDWYELGIASVITVVTYAAIRTPLRFLSQTSPYPSGYTQDLIIYPSVKLDLITIANNAVLSRPLWAALFVGLLALASLCVRPIVQWRDRPMVMIGLLAMLVAAIFHYFAITASIAVILLLLKQFTMSEFRRRGGGRLLVILFVSALFWVAYGCFTTDWPEVFAKTDGALQPIAIFLYQYVRFPDVLSQIVRPFAATVPITGLLLLLGIATVVVREITAATPLRTESRLLTLLLLLLLLGIGASDPPRQETRYAFFLYPLCILLAATGVARLVAKARIATRISTALSATMILGLFAASEDSNLRHLLTVDSPESTFRVEFNPMMRAHLGEARDDFRALSSWLRAHASPGSDLVVNGVHGLDYYFSGTNYFFVDNRSSNFLDWSCHAGSVDRWTNLPLIYTFADLRTKTANVNTTFLITWDFAVEDFRRFFSDRDLRVAAVAGSTVVLAIGKRG